MKRLRLAVAFPFVIGIFIGTSITSFLLLAVQSIDEDPTQKSAVDEALPDLSIEERKDAEGPQENLPVYSPSKVISYNVLTSKSSLSEQGFAIHRTWGGEKALQGSMDYYVFPRAGKEEMDYATARKIPVVSLEMDEKSAHKHGLFKLWESLCEEKQGQYLWFVKVRDDTYVRTRELTKLLASFNSSKSLFIGKSVSPHGKTREDLGLREGETYCHEACYIFSFKLLEELCPLLPSCQENIRSDNEDVEIARCIRAQLGVNCTAAAEVERLFYSANSLAEQEELQTGELSYNAKVNGAVTVTPMTKPSHFYSIHRHYTMALLESISINNTRLRSHIIQTAERGAQSDSLLHSSELQSPPWTKLGVNPPHKPTNPEEDVLHFQLSDKNSVFAESKHEPRRSIGGAEKVNNDQVFKAVVKSQKDHGFISNSSITNMERIFKRTDPQRGTDYLVEVNVKDKDQFISTKYLHGLHELLPPQVTAMSSADYKSTKVNFVVATPPVSRGFQRFIMSFENSFLARKPMEHVGMLVLMYSDGLMKAYDKDLFAVSTLINLYRSKYPEADLRLVTTKSKYSRTEMLKLASREHASYELLFLADIHIDFSMQFLERCRMNTLENKQVYFPAVFNPYNPVEFYKERLLYPYATKFHLNERRGSWMQNSYHLACVYNYDLMKALTEAGTAGDDSKWSLVDQFLHQNHLRVFRSVEPGLVHLWQDSCDEVESGSQEETACKLLNNP